jgi:hypothetical protein
MLVSCRQALAIMLCTNGLYLTVLPHALLLAAGCRLQFRLTNPTVHRIFNIAGGHLQALHMLVVYLEFCIAVLPLPQRRLW